MLPVSINPLPNGPYPVTVGVGHYDAPADSYDLQRMNGLTSRMNDLQAVQLEFAFCAALVARPPSGRLRFLRAFYWNTRWQSNFERTSAGVVAHPVAGGNGCNVGKIFEGDPNDRRFKSIFQYPPATNCNDVFAAATTNPNVKEARGWASFDVRR